MSETKPASPVVLQLPNPSVSVGVFANQFVVASDGSSIYVTFVQVSPSPIPVSTLGGKEIVKHQTQNAPMLATPVSRVILSQKDARLLSEGLQQIITAIEQATQQDDGV
jgi:hypothetical protein